MIFLDCWIWKSLAYGVETALHWVSAWKCFYYFSSLYHSGEQQKLGLACLPFFSLLCALLCFSSCLTKPNLDAHCFVLECILITFSIAFAKLLEKFGDTLKLAWVLCDRKMILLPLLSVLDVAEKTDGNKFLFSTVSIRTLSAAIFWVFCHFKSNLSDAFVPESLLVTDYSLCPACWSLLFTMALSRSSENSHPLSLCGQFRDCDRKLNLTAEWMACFSAEKFSLTLVCCCGWPCLGMWSCQHCLWHEKDF